MDYVRVSIGANRLKSDLNIQFGMVVGALTKNPQLRNKLARKYGEIVTPYVPRSNRNSTHHHLQTFSVSDGRILWTRKDSKGNEIAKDIFDGTRGDNWVVRPDGGNQYGAHQPRCFWTDAMNESSNWQVFVEEAQKIIEEDLRNGQK